MQRFLLQGSAMILVLAIPGIAHAQSSSGAAASGAQAGTSQPDSGALQEIVVTAQRRTENLQNVPIAATALSGSQLEDKAVSRISDLQFAAPSLSVTDAGLTQSVNIRGIGIASGSPSVANGVAVYINGIFQPPLLTASSFYDIGSIEVLRGPQGTLVGSNSTGGAMFINAQAPILHKFGGYLQGGLGNYASRTAQGALNIPITDNLAVRVAGNYQKHDSYYTDIGVYHNTPGRLDEKAGRIGVLWNLGGFKATGHVEWIDRDTGGYAYRPLPLPLAVSPYAADAGRDPFTLDYDSPTMNREKGFLSDLELRYQFPGGVTLRSQSGYVNKRIKNLYDSDGTAIAPTTTSNQFVQEQEWVQELNLISPTTGRFNWILGGYYQRNQILVDILTTASAPTDPTHILIHDYKTTTGAFAQGGYKITDQVELQLGIRYSHYSVTQSGGVAIGYGTLFGPNGLTVADLGSVHKDGRLTGKANINFKVDDNNLIYAFAARGYKPGGANSATSEFRPETVWDYELGWKSNLLGNHVRTQLGAFYMAYNDFQFDFVDTSSGQSGVTNVSNATIYGFEGQIQAKLAGFDIDGGFAYVHSKLNSTILAVNRQLIPGGVQLLPQCAPGQITQCTDYTNYLEEAGGGPNLFSPTWSYNVGIDYELKLGEGISLTPRVNYAYVGPQYATYFYNPKYDLLKSRGLVSGLVTLRYKQWTIEAYGNNLTDKTYISGVAGNEQYFGAPREYGVRVGVRF